MRLVTNVPIATLFQLLLSPEVVAHLMRFLQGNITRPTRVVSASPALLEPNCLLH